MLGIPVIELPQGSNFITFKNHFNKAYSSNYAEQRRRSNWLQEICQGSGRTGGEIMAQALDYNPDTGYYCLKIAPRDRDGCDQMTIDLKVEAIKNLVKKELSKLKARVLYFFDGNAIVALFPWVDRNNPLAIKKCINELAKTIRQEEPELRWRIVIGSHARRLSDFRTSYEHTAQLFTVMERLGVNERASRSTSTWATPRCASSCAWR